MWTNYKLEALCCLLQSLVVAMWVLFHVVALVNVFSFSYILWSTTTQPVPQSFMKGFEIAENQLERGDEYSSQKCIGKVVQLWRKGRLFWACRLRMTKSDYYQGRGNLGELVNSIVKEQAKTKFNYNMRRVFTSSPDSPLLMQGSFLLSPKN